MDPGDGELALTPEPLFAEEPLGATEARALEIVRASGISPARLQSSDEMDELVVGEDSIAARWGAVTGSWEVHTTESASIFYRHVGLTRLDFERARRFLNYEHRAFSRTLVAGPEETFVMRHVDGSDWVNEEVEYVRYGATLAAPTQLPDVWWSTVVRFDATPALIAPGEDIDEEYFVPQLRTGYEYAPGTSYGVGYENPSLLVADVEVAERALASSALMSYAGAMSDALGTLGRPRAVTACLFENADGTVSAAMYPNPDEDDESSFEIVVGRAGLDCALSGVVDGVPCTQTMFDAHRGGVAFDGLLTTTQKVDRGEAEAGAGRITLFLVRNSSGRATPGSYMPVTGFAFTTPSTSTYGTNDAIACQTTIVSPEFDHLVASLVAPSVNNPGRSDQTCVEGLSRDFRIPLENELTDNRDGLENSWRHYLDSAMVAADRADQLGEVVIQAGLEMDMRAENALDEVNQICGTSISLSSLGVPPGTLDFWAWLRGLREPEAGATPEQLQLADCLEPEPESTVAVLGSEPLWAWEYRVDDGDCADPIEVLPNSLCSQAGAVQCPRTDEIAVDDVPMAIMHGGETYRACPVQLTNMLRLFSSVDGSMSSQLGVGGAGGTSEEALPCELIAQARRGFYPVEKIFDYPFVAPANLRRHAQQLNIDPRVGDYVRVTYAGTPVFSTLPSDGLWPLTSTGVGGVPLGTVRIPATCGPSNGRASLFCKLNGSADLDGSSGVERLTRARENDRLMRAVFAARLFSGAGHGDMLTPFYPAQTGRGDDSHRINGFDIDDDAERYVFGDVARITAGTLLIDGDYDDGSTGYEERSFDDLGVTRLEWVLNGGGVGAASACDPEAVSGNTQIREGVDWIIAPWWSTSFYVMDEADDCDDAYDDDGFVSDVPRALALGSSGSDQLPFMVRRFGSGVDRGDRQVVARDGGAARLEAAFRAVLGGTGRDSWVGWLPALMEASDRRGNHFAEATRSDVDGADRERYMAQFGNAASIVEITPADVLNGLEMTCQAARRARELNLETSSCPSTAEARAYRVADAERFQSRLECRSAELQSRLASGAIGGLSAEAIRAIQGGVAVGSIGSQSGELAAQYSDLAGGLIEVRNNAQGMSEAMRTLGAQVRELRENIRGTEFEASIADLQLASQIFDRATSCVVATAEAVGDHVKLMSGAGVVAATATCANAIAQSTLAVAVNGQLQGQINAGQNAMFARFDQSMTAASTRLEQLGVSTRAQYSRVNGALARINGLRQRARSQLSRALFLMSVSGVASTPVGSVLHARYSTALTRYRDAHELAVRSAYIARIALEQRLGMPLSEMNEDLVTVERPSRWADTICELPSIDYQAIRGEMGEQSVLDSETGFAGLYVGDYVRRLQQVFESYSFRYPFQAGTDIAVVSLRDDLNRVRRDCDVPGPNLLRYSSRFDERGTAMAPGWRAYGCAELTSEPTENACVAAEPYSGTGPVSAWDAEVGGPGWSQVRFGGSPDLPLAADRWLPTARLGQRLTLSPGRYRLSWYQNKDLAGFTSTNGLVRVTTVDEEGQGTTLSGVRMCDAPAETEERCYAFLDISAELEVEVRIQAPLSYDDSADAESDVYLVTGVMLEDVSDSLVGALDGAVSTLTGTQTLAELAKPPTYYDTGATTMVRARACVDSAGEVFRRDHFRAGCVRACPLGYEDHCSDELATRRCYWQTELPISSDDLQAVLVNSASGFAAGNYNYRVDAIGVNLVGTGLRNCEVAGLEGSASCYGSGNVSYSLLHGGQFLVRNARGELYDAPLFPGRIESARALAAERYVTNPISSADQSLLQPYMRNEFQGRPLGGTLTLRIWDDPGFVFDNLEDVQIVLNYRYWTHQR